MTKYYIAKPGGSGRGPYTVAQIVEGCANGKVSPSMMVCAEGSTEWMPVTSLPGVSFPGGGVPTAPTAPAAAADPVTPSMMAPQAAFPHAAMGGSSNAMPLPTFSAFAPWSFLICCVGWVWGIVTWFKMCAAINQLAGTNRCVGASILVFPWWVINVKDVVDSINDIIRTRGLQVPPMTNNIALNILVPGVPFMNMITTWNAIAATENAKR